MNESSNVWMCFQIQRKKTWNVLLWPLKNQLVHPVIQFANLKHVTKNMGQTFQLHLSCNYQDKHVDILRKKTCKSLCITLLLLELEIILQRFIFSASYATKIVQIDEGMSKICLFQVKGVTCMMRIGTYDQFAFQSLKSLDAIFLAFKKGFVKFQMALPQLFKLFKTNKK